MVTLQFDEGALVVKRRNWIISRREPRTNCLNLHFKKKVLAMKRQQLHQQRRRRTSTASQKHKYNNNKWQMTGGVVVMVLCCTVRVWDGSTFLSVSFSDLIEFLLYYFPSSLYFTWKFNKFNYNFVFFPLLLKAMKDQIRLF